MLSLFRSDDRPLLRFAVPALAAAATSFCPAAPAHAGSLASPPGNGTYMIKALHSGKCLAVKNASTSDGAPIQQFPCDPQNASQRFTLTTVGQTNVILFGVTYTIPLFTLTTFTGKCAAMRVNFVSSLGEKFWYAMGNYVEQQTCLPDLPRYQKFFWAPAQHPWEGMTIRSPNDGTALSSHLCLHIQSASSDSGAGPLLDSCNLSGTGSKNDSFVFMPVSP
ncbi:RICIN domain-containing protein [Chondromyces apiculatus]|uniref:Ricin B lectin domain-containing protein n=1 Tax=Chondromyces apiculatus DSM 436 TaxID=1192034 RepID=A0A017TA37_9BACT|nr:RICIN domain-containing protein [Chondromyces apiculatus]EYF06133.1 Hypothetical protein CAP_2323 [Chondromyces apiculatus DSM 436]